MEPRTVQIGDQSITITRFRGLKAILAGALVARVMREVPQLQDTVTQFAKDFREKNTVKITPAMAKLPRFSIIGLTAEDFGGREYIEMPDEPNGNQILIAVMPDLFDMARREVMRFLALIAISNAELETADDADEVEVALDRKGKELLRHADVDELLELGLVGWEVFQDQITAKRDRLGKLLELPFLRTLRSTLEDQAAPTEEDQEEDLPSPTSLDNVPSSPTDSEPSTDGTEEQLSTASPGTN